nr:MAG TPA: hypothetical protein [Bacteriophage sp.]
MKRYLKLYLLKWFYYQVSTFLTNYLLLLFYLHISK